MGAVFANTLLSFGEPLVCAAALLAYLRAEKPNQYPVFKTFLLIKLGSSLALLGLLHSRAFLHIPRSVAYTWYFYAYWTTYLATAVTIFCVIQELFQHATEPLPGLRRLGVVTFRWVAGISLVAAIAATLTPKLSGVKLVLTVVDQILRCQSIFELFLLLFLVVSARKLGLSFRSRVFGISLGFGILAANDLLISSVFLTLRINNHPGVTWINTCSELLTAVIWCAYFMQGEPARRPLSLPATSSLVRWNEVATALGQTSHPPAAAMAGHGDFFLQDVEQVVDRILTKNSLNAAG